MGKVTGWRLVRRNFIKRAFVIITGTYPSNITRGSPMSDKYTLQLKNFRSIRDAEIDISPLTVVYGPNGSGKSSLIYGLLTLKNFLTEPNRNLPGLFSYPGISLGGFGEVVLAHNEDDTVDVALSIATQERGVSRFTLSLGQATSKSAICVDEHITKSNFDMALNVPLPYRLDRSINAHSMMEWYTWWEEEEEYDFTYQTEIDIGWNGISLNLNYVEPIGWGEEGIAHEFLKWANSPMEGAKGIYFVPSRREFKSPGYGAASVSPTLNGGVDVASILVADHALELKVSEYMERVADRQIHARPQVGSSSFIIDSIPRNRETPVSIVNEGFGVNQLAYLLTIVLYDKAKFVLIEEPEIHLHPSMIRKLVHAFVDIVSNNDKRFVISTHSETFVVALLAQIAAGKIDVDDVSFILAEKENGESKFTKQEAKPNGQIQGGLESFIASEFEDMAAFLGLDSEAAQS